MNEKYKMAAELAKMARLAEGGVHRADRSVITGLVLGAAEMQKLEMENENLLKEIEVLREWGNKDCTSMADERLTEMGIPIHE